MKFGYFDDNEREYVITTPETPYPWINYLGNKDFFSLISNTGGGYSFYKDALLRRISRYRYNNSTLDNNGKYYYINDDGEIWNPGWKPVKTSLDFYACHHGLGYTKIIGEKNNLTAELLAFVPLDFKGEVNRLVLKNKSQVTKKIQLFSLVEFCLWNAWEDMTNFQRTYSIGRVEPHESSLIHFTDYRDRRNHFAFFSVNQDIDGFDCDKETFTGTHNGFESPDVVRTGKSMKSPAYGWSPIGSHHLDISLNPGEEKNLIFILGYVENEEKEKWDSSGQINKKTMYEMQDLYGSIEAVNKGLSDLRDYWDDLLGKYQTETGIKQTDRMVNIWNPYQCMVTFNLSRSASYFESGIGRGLGFRDSNQDMLGFVHLVPERARQRLIDLASTQLEDGGAYHQYQPLTKKGNHEIGSGFNDDPLWMICGVIAYLKETGDFSLLNEKIPYNNNPENTSSMFEHLKRSFYYTINNLGPHGLPLIGRADWNDCLNLNSYNDNPDQSFQTGEMRRDGTVAESIMIAGAFVFYGKQFAELCAFLGKKDEEVEAKKHIENMITTVKKHGWDGEWFLRAYDANGQPVGSKDNDEGKIFIESQGFCGMAKIGLEEGYVSKSLNSVEKNLVCDYGIVLQNPAFSKFMIEYGEISTYIEGYKENAGIFCHNNPWIMIAETIVGRGEKAYDYWRKIAPAHLEDISEIHRTEPYVYAQMIAGKDAHIPGEAKNSWLTGTAAWNYVAISQNILGIQPDFDVLVIDPCIPPSWDGYSVTRKFRGVEYTIIVKNPNHVSKGIATIALDGKPIESNRVPILTPQSQHVVEVTLGSTS